MGKFGALVIGALIPTAVAVHCYREGREARAQYVQVQSSYAQAQQAYETHMEQEGKFLVELQDNLRSARESFTGLTQTALEVSADCGGDDAMPATLELVKQYRSANQEIKALVDGQLATITQYDASKDATPVRAKGSARRELEQQLAALVNE